jgi:Rod binding domain-containing protein
MTTPAVPLRPWGEVVRAYEAAGEAGAEANLKRLRDVADDFASILYGMMMKSMRATVQKTGLLDGGQAEEIFRDFLDAEYAREAGRRGGAGVAVHVFEHALIAYEAASRSGRPAPVPALPPTSLGF